MSDDIIDQLLVEQVTPQRGMCGIGCGHCLDDVHRALEFVVGILLDLVPSVCQRVVTFLVDDEEFVLGVDRMDLVEPPFRRSRDHSGSIGPGAFVGFGHRRNRFITFELDVVTGPFRCVLVTRMSQVDVPFVDWHRVSVAVATV